MVGLIAVSKNLVLVLISEKWIAIVPYIQILSVAYLINMLQSGSLQSIKAIGRSDIVLKMKMIKKVLYAIVIVVFIIFSNSPVELALSSVVCAVINISVNLYYNKRLIGYRYRDTLIDVIPNIVPSVIMGAAVLYMNRLNINMYCPSSCCGNAIIWPNGSII